MANETKTHWNLEILLSSAIDKAERFGIEAVFKSISNKQPYSFFTYTIENINEEFNNFRIELRDKLTNANNSKTIEIDVKDRFFPMLNAYIDWYLKNIDHFEKFGDNNPYKIMIDYVRRTKSEIIKYFKISDAEKKECDRFYLPFGFNYKLKNDRLQSRIKALDNDFENTSEYANALKSLIQSNGLHFFYEIKDLERNKFLDAINIQFNYYSETCNDMYRWLNVTYDLVIKGFDIAGTVSMDKQSDFREWFNLKIKENNSFYKAEIVSYLIGQRNNENSPITIQPCFHFIKAELKKYNLTPIEAKELINDFKGSFSAEWNKNVIPFVIDYLKEIEPNFNNAKTSAKIPNSKVNEIIEPTLKQIALYHVYLGTKINKYNANEYLKGTKHKSGHKLKQEFDKLSLTMNKTGNGTDRENNYKLKLFNSVILMLKEIDNKDALLKAENELKQFEKNIA